MNDRIQSKPAREANPARRRFSDRTVAFATQGSTAWAVSDRAAALAAAGADVISLTVGDVDVDTPADVVAAAHRSLDLGRTHFAPVAGDRELRAAIATRANVRNGTRYGADNVVVFPGAQCALYSTLQCLAGPGDEVVLLEPVYATYEAVIGASGARAVTVSLRDRGALNFSIERIENALSARTRVLVLNTPNNPSGFVVDAADIGRLARLCALHGIWLVSDEVYAELAYDRPHRSPASCPEISDQLVLVDSLSKSHAMTGWRLGWAIGPVDLAVHLEALAQAELFGSPPFVQDAARVALASTQQIPATLRALYRERRDVLLDGLIASPALRPIVPHGGMFVLVDVSATGLDGQAFAEHLLEEAGVAVVPGGAFGASVRDCVRLGLTQPAPRLREACARIAGWVNRR